MPVTASDHESSEGDCETARGISCGYGDLPDEQGIVNVLAETGSDQKIATSHTESDPVETGSGPRTATDLTETTSESERDATESDPKTATTRERTATKTSPVDDALDSLTARGKWNESKIDETGHKSGLYDPSLFLDPKIGKRGRIANRSGPPKTLPTHHVTERAVMSGERQPRKQGGQGASAATSSSPLPSSRRS